LVNARRMLLRKEGASACRFAASALRIVSKTFSEILQHVRSGSIKPALDRPDRAFAYLRCFIVGDAGHADQEQHFTIVRRETVHRLLDISNAAREFLICLYRSRVGNAFRKTGCLASSYFGSRSESVPHDREHPRLQSSIRFEAVEAFQRSQERLLNQIVGVRGISGQGPSKCFECRDQQHYRRVVSLTFVHLVQGNLVPPEKLCSFNAGLTRRFQAQNQERTCQ
jgi:hypothetical protein